ncbi:glycosyl/glycerophosphate transferase [Halorubrum distributum JCM 9100]|uniref:Glycosyl/glycerophosphate transferase n=2 Tax=Halorubrum distributum TaxID=29283 RepID=M0EVR5_9EURY|nr:glycosyl/glycerophosphate transferase [Halorubrum distributum JCM 9100]ELZ53041.1 glycosyl/glycerophosphate transferase [Halorubrum distributum JCM 10118]
MLELTLIGLNHFFPYLLLFYNATLFYITLGLTHIVGRDDSRLVFANVARTDFSDNTKYMFLYMNKEHGEAVRPIWLTENPELQTDLQNRGYEAYNATSLSGRLQLLRAGHVFFDGTMREYKWAYTAGATRYQLRHGIPLKSPPKRDVGLFESALWRRTQQYDYVVTNSERDLEHCRKYTESVNYGVECNKAGIDSGEPVETGFPRNDVILREIKGERIGVPEEMEQTFDAVTEYDFVVGFFPTFRLQGSISPFESGEFEEYLQSENIAILIRPHRQVTVDYPESKHIYELPAYGDVYPFLDRLDVLVTDYSSIGFDFSVTGKPVLFYTFDREQYEEERGVHEDYDRITVGNRVTNQAELLERLRSIQRDSEPESSVLTEFFTHRDGRSAERLAEVVL